MPIPGVQHKHALDVSSQRHGVSVPVAMWSNLRTATCYRRGIGDQKQSGSPARGVRSSDIACLNVLGQPRLVTNMHSRDRHRSRVASESILQSIPVFRICRLGSTISLVTKVGDDQHANMRRRDPSSSRVLYRDTLMDELDCVSRVWCHSFERRP